MVGCYALNAVACYLCATHIVTTTNHNHDLCALIDNFFNFGCKPGGSFGI